MACHVFYIYMAHHPYILCWQAVRFYTSVANIQYNTEYCEIQYTV